MFSCDLPSVFVPVFESELNQIPRFSVAAALKACPLSEPICFALGADTLHYPMAAK
jgi:hypothetical protein